MAVDDLWFLAQRGPDGTRLPSKRHGRGRRYRVRWVDDAGRPRQQLFDRKADAERHDARMRADVSRGVYVDPSAGRVTVAAYAGAWRATLLHRESTARRLEGTLRVHVEPYFGGMGLAQVRPSHIQAWIKDRSRVLAPSTVRIVYHVLVAMFAAAVRDRVIGTTPCVGVRLPELERTERFIPTPEQVHQLAEAMSTPALQQAGSAGRRTDFSALVYLAAGAGLRQGEAWGLELEHIDFLRREITVVQQLVETRGAARLGPPKTVTSRRVVELGQVVAEALARHIERHPPEPIEVVDATDPRRSVTRRARLLFTSDRGNPLRRSTWSYPWAKAVATVPGVPEGFGFHGLRHYYATLLIHGGASVKTVQMALGHARPTITLDTYAGEWPEAVDRTRSLVDAALGGRPTRSIRSAGAG